MSTIYSSPQLIAPSRRPNRPITQSAHKHTSNGHHNSYATPVKHNANGDVTGAPQTATHQSPYNNIILVTLFILAISLLIYTFTTLPHLPPADSAQLKFPRSMKDVAVLSNILNKYTNDYYINVLTVFCALYIFLQAFAIPGAIFLSVLAGPLFGKYTGLLIVSVVATSGATLCYTISKQLGKKLVPYYFPTLLNNARRRIDEHRHNILYYLLFLRISPLLPNWFISLSAPHLNISYTHFILATFIGLIPANYIHVTTGIQLDELGHTDSAQGVKWTNLAALMGIAVLALLPTLFKGKLEQIDEKTKKTH